MLETIRTDITLLDDLGQLEFFLSYAKRREEDMAKAPTYVPGGAAKKKKKAKAKAKAGGAKKGKGKAISVSKLKQLDAATLALLRKAGVGV